jgi:iron complex outermembrane receptor protein
MKKILTAISLVLSASLFAQDNERVLDPVTITSSLVSKPISQTGRNIITIKGEEFSRLPVNSIDELLRYLPGVEVQMRGPMGSQSDIVLRGGTFQQVLVIVDGVRVNDPNTGHFSSYIPISPAEIDHIEILKGASSAIYGSEAVGGVINIITKTFAAKQQPAKRYQAQADVMGGEYKLMNANIGGFYQQNKTAIGGGWLSNNTEGQLQRGTRGFVYANTASLSVSHYFNERWQFALRAAYDNRRFSAQNFYTTFASDTANEKVNSLWAQARLSYTGRKHHVIADMGWKSVDDEYHFNRPSIPNQNKSMLMQATIYDEWKVSDRTVLVNGVQVLNKEIRSNDRGDHNLMQAGAFVVLNQMIGDLTINPALRLDYNERIGVELLPQLNVSWARKGFQLRASAGKTIRDADFTERYNNYNKAVVTSGRIGNPDLEAERSLSYEAGADYMFAKNFKVSGTFFQRRHKRLIDYVPTAYADMPRKDNLVPAGNYALAKNVTKVNTTGGELDLQYQKNFKRMGSVYAGVGLVWLRSRSSDTIPSFYVSSHATFLNNFFVTYTHRFFFLSINGIYKTRDAQAAAAIHANLTEDYFVLNARIGPAICNGRVKLYAQISNIFNVTYSDLLGAQMPGRWLMGGVSLSLSK